MQAGNKNLRIQNDTSTSLVDGVKSEVQVTNLTQNIVNSSIFNTISMSNNLTFKLRAPNLYVRPSYKPIYSLKKISNVLFKFINHS